jgi:hypothetical protein
MRYKYGHPRGVPVPAPSLLAFLSPPTALTMTHAHYQAVIGANDGRGQKLITGT